MSGSSPECSTGFRDLGVFVGGFGGEECFEGAGGVGSHAGEGVLVGLDGEHELGVAESFGDDLRVHVGGEEQAGVGVAQVVEPDDRDGGAAHDAVEGSG